MACYEFWITKINALMLLDDEITERKVYAIE